VNDENETNGNQPSQPTQPTRPASDLSSHDLYFVALHVANLVITAEGVGVAPRVQKRLQRVLDDIIREYHDALAERDELKKRFES
jgi:hypothetical protein